MDKRYTTCYMCAGRCGIEINFTDKNQIRYIKGNNKHPVNKGVMCAKGNAAIMKQQSPAKLTQPLLRKPNSERGSGEFQPISWNTAIDILTKRLKKIRAENPNKLAYFTGRDQMQAFTGLWASQFGTMNWAAHGGFCSVNIAAAGLYTLGYSFWEFGEPDWDRTKYFLLWGVAEDHGSNPIKIGLNKLKKRGAKFVAINPVGTGYQGIADEWLPIKPGTDGMLALALIHVLLTNELIDTDFLIKYTNAHWLVIINPNRSDDGLFYRDNNNNPQYFDEELDQIVSTAKNTNNPVLVAELEKPDGIKLKTVMQIIIEQYCVEEYSPLMAEKICGIKAETIERIAFELAEVAFEETIEIKTPWTDFTGKQHDSFVGRPVSMHAMRGVSAHSNGFQTTRAIHLLQILLGTIDCPGGFRAKAPFPRPIPPSIKPAKKSQADTPLNSPPLGFPVEPEDLLIDKDGNPTRIDKAYSWDAPIANHGLMHMVISNAYNGDPYHIDTLMLFMANMAWNSSMNTMQTIDMLIEKNNEDQYKIPFLVVIDTFDSETVKYADLVLPDTTFLERHDCISLLDRPISDPDYICDSVRIPVLTPDRDVKPWQEVMIILANRLKFPAFVNKDGSKKYKDYKDFIINYEKSPGIGFLAGFRGQNGDKDLIGDPNPKQWEAYEKNGCFYQYELPENMRYFKAFNQNYLNFAKENGLIPDAKPIIIQLYSEPLQKFKLAGQGLYDGPKPKAEVHKNRLTKYFSPLPDYYQPLEWQQVNTKNYPLHAITQRPMTMYHSWDSQNAWLRQIVAQNYLYVNRKTGQKLNLKDLSWAWLSSPLAKIRVQVKLTETCQEDTVWTWNAIGKKQGNWGLDKKAPEVEKGFLLNHLISELLVNERKEFVTNSDPITGQAAWYDLRVNIKPCKFGETGFAYQKMDENICV